MDSEKTLITRLSCDKTWLSENICWDKDVIPKDVYRVEEVCLSGETDVKRCLVPVRDTVEALQESLTYKGMKTAYKIFARPFEILFPVAGKPCACLTGRMTFPISDSDKVARKIAFTKWLESLKLETKASVSIQGLCDLFPNPPEVPESLRNWLNATWEVKLSKIFESFLDAFLQMMVESASQWESRGEVAHGEKLRQWQRDLCAWKNEKTFALQTLISIFEEMIAYKKTCGLKAGVFFLATGKLRFVKEKAKVNKYFLTYGCDFERVMKEVLQ